MDSIVINEYGDEKVLVLQKVDIPKPGKNQALIKVHAAGVNPIDVLFRLGAFGPVNPKTPFTCGMDISGVVEEAGEGSKWKKGDRVYSNCSIGGYAQYAVSSDSNIFSLPENVSFEQGSALYVPYYTAALGFETIKTQPSDVVLVHGASGGVGLAVVQLAKLKGYKEIWGTAGSEDGLKLLTEQGCTKVFNHRKEGYVQEIINAGGADVIFEMAVSTNLNNDVQISKIGGRILFVGNKAKVEIDPNQLMMKRITTSGYTLLFVTEEEKLLFSKEIGEGLTSGKLSPVISKTYPLSQASQAHHDIWNNPAKGRLVLLPW